jgi:hypothetical protein
MPDAVIRPIALADIEQFRDVTSSTRERALAARSSTVNTTTCT